MSTTTGYPTYNLTAMSKEEFLQNHNSEFLSQKKENIDLPKLNSMDAWLHPFL